MYREQGGGAKGVNKSECDRPQEGQQAFYLSILKQINWRLQIETSYSLVS